VEHRLTNIAAVLVLAAGTAAIYSGTFAVPFLWDDIDAIVNNFTIRHWWPLGPVLLPPLDTGVGGRPLINLSYALNYAFGGTAVFGYHAVNLLIHVLAAAVLFALVRRTLQLPSVAGRFGSAATPLALAISALWAWHPVQTEAVTYVTQRAESLMGLFYFLTLYSFVRYAGPTKHSIRWDWLCVLSCLAGVGSKEVMVTAPVMVLLFDRTFVSGSFAAAWRRHRSLYLSLAVTWLLLAFLLSGLNQRAAGFGLGVTAWTYALTESGVIVHYLLLALWPHPLVFDHQVNIATRLSQVWPYASVIALLLAGTLVLLRRKPAAGFLAAWFFLILAPTSSLVPLAGQPMAEHRVYLPLASIVAAAVLSAYLRAGRRCLWIFGLVAVGLGVASVVRNRDYASERAIWSDTVAKDPSNPRAHNNLGNALLDLNSPEELPRAIAELETALQLSPDFARAHNNLGLAWSRVPGRSNEAIAQYQAALRLNPDYAEAHLNLGNAWFAVPDRLDDSIGEYQQAVRLNPRLAEAHYDLGTAWWKVPGRLGDSIAQYEEAVRLKPDFAAARYNLALGLLNVPGGANEAKAQLEAVLRLQPDNTSARQMLNSITQTVP